MCAVVRPRAGTSVREVCARWGLPAAVIGRVTEDGDIAIVDRRRWTPTGGRLRAREIARIPAAALTSDAIVHERLAAPPTHRRGRAGARRARSSRSDRLPERGMDPGAVLLALLGSAEPVVAPRRSSTQYDSTVGADTVAGRGRGAAVLRVKGTTKALVATTDGNAPVGALDPWLGAALSVAEATRNVSITGARPLGVTNCLNYGDPTRPEAFWQLDRGASAASATPAGRSACRSRAATSRSTTSRRPARSPRRPRSASSVCSRTSRRSSDRRSSRAATRSCSSARRRRAWPGSAYARARRRGRRGRPARPRPGARGGAPGVHPRGDRRAASSHRRRTCRAAGWRSPSPSARCGAASGADLGCPSRIAGGGAVRREPVAARRHLPAAVRPGARRCWPASTACRSRRWIGRRRATRIELVGAGATGAAEERGAGSPTPSTSPSPTCATPGSRASPARSAGRS